MVLKTYEFMVCCMIIKTAKDLASYRKYQIQMIKETEETDSHEAETDAVNTSLPDTGLDSQESDKGISEEVELTETENESNEIRTTENLPTQSCVSSEVMVDNYKAQKVEEKGFKDESDEGASETMSATDDEDKSRYVIKLQNFS